MAFFDSSLLSCHFRLFTEVLRKVFGSLTQEVWEFFGETPDYPLRDSYGAQAADVRAYDCRGSRVGCSVINAGVTPIRLRSGQALPLQLDYFGANEATIFRSMAPRPTKHPDLRIQVSYSNSVRTFSLAGRNRTGL